MSHAEHAVERATVREPASVVVPAVRVNEPKSPRRRKRPCGSAQARLQSAGALKACDDFRYYVDSRGCQHFNFEQKLWRYPSVQMAVTPVMTVALETLALNLLAHITGTCGDGARLGVTSKGLIGLARRFCEQCLLTACPAGWVIPRSTIEAWLTSQQRLRGSKRARLSYAKQHGTAQRIRR
jgi:hypothetical protein